MATLTLYKDEDLKEIAFSGFVGTWKEIKTALGFLDGNDVTIGEETIHFTSFWRCTSSTIDSYSDATELIIDPTETDETITLYLSGESRFSYKFYKASSNTAIFDTVGFEIKINGTWTSAGRTHSIPIGTTKSGNDWGKICFRFGETETITDVFGYDVTTYDNQGRAETHRCFNAVSPYTKYYIDSDLKPYTPPKGSKRRGGTGSGYYPNSTIPALPTGSINAAFSSVLGTGNGLTYYKLTGNSFIEITEYLYDCAPTLKFRNSVYRDAIASCIFIPYDVTADVTNTLGLVYLANKSIPVSGGCDIITTPLKEIDFGEVNLTANNIGFRNFVDYIHTTAVLYLPCFGAVNIDMSAIVGGILHLRGVLDVRNGNILYRLESQADMDDTPVLYGQYTGQCGIQVPIGGANSQMSVTGAISSIGSIGVGIASGNPLNIVGGISSLASQTAPDIDISGAMQPLGAALGTPVPILQIRKHVMCAPPDYEEIHGLPSDATLDGVYDGDIKTVGDYSGFFRAAAADVSGLSGATDQEKAEVEALLKEGVFV